MMERMWKEEKIRGYTYQGAKTRNETGGGARREEKEKKEGGNDKRNIYEERRGT